MGNALWIFIAIVVISALVGAVAQVLNKLTEQQNQARRENPRRGDGGGTVRQSSNDIDRFLAEIDRLRRRGPDGGGAAPAARPVRPQPARPRIVAEAVEPRRVEPLSLPVATVVAGPPQPLAPPPSPILADLPVAQVVAPAPQVATVTALPPPLSAPVTPRAILGRRPKGTTARTRFGRDLAALLGSGNGVAMAVVLQEVLGPPKGRRG